MVVYSEDMPEGIVDPIWLYPLGDDANTNLAIPHELQRELQEGRHCFAYRLYTASVVMAGRTLEGMAFLHGVNERTLVQSLKKLEENGILDGRLVEWATQLRVMRNEAAHFDGGPVSRQDAADVLALTEAILDYVYIFTRRFEEFMRRRSNREQK